jgi:hypothetical protein
MSRKKLTRKEFSKQVENSNQWINDHNTRSGYDLNNVGSSIRFEKSLKIKFEKSYLV